MLFEFFERESLVEKKIRLDGVDTFGLLGLNDANLQIIENRFDASIFVRGESMTIRGSQQEVEQLEKILKELIFILHKNGSLTTNDVDTVIDLVTANGEPALPKGVAASLSREELDTIILYTKNQIIRAKTPGQREYVRAVKRNDIVFAVGPAGTGKTYMAVAIAVAS